ncbi:N(2)-acetyl-L-2,4-diaminobutanoate deacetylase DoeB [Paracoccus aerodenitrificans]|uniref:N(2)-acetyl-L-2,4-diaminobutanoate deacetylase DoeB n=1 Tax=Paracoccus aerodenitrificans TaxID=3017781 RepID=UPI0022F11186|nr:N(2)-acetyl-L-2,4-diaminobutanoate deacetylase DoeB [Paracoccus aerodenitrificans]WBU63902.1 N(2)-acetyl-L-2,4-diaminobutanoate deacetylase DoeB [Paracoccus aerodenitrificans]
MTANPIRPTIPFDGQGKHHGFLRLPYSRNDSAWGSVMIPITVIANGQGPTALLTGGNHGDEYEGPIALQQLAWEIAPEQVSGRVIIVPYMNYPAFRAGTRVSPIDSVNLNRAFPGRPDGTVSQKIANYFNDVLTPMADIVLDFHSGGKTLDFLPYAAAHYLEDKDQQSKCVAAMKAFGAPYSMMMLEIDAVGMFDTAVEVQGKVFVTTELGGGGTASARTAEIAIRGAKNLLRHTGILTGQIEAGESTMLDMPGDECFHFAERDGLLHMLVDLGDPVTAGQPIAHIWAPDRTGVAPVEVRANRDGILAARHFLGLVQSGDCLAVIAVTQGLSE